MAIDRLVRFDGIKPTSKDIDSLLRKYIGSSGDVQMIGKHNINYWVIHFDGEVSFVSSNSLNNSNKERWIELFYHQSEKEVKIDVLTHQMDEFTNDIAIGIVNLLQRHWNGIKKDIEHV